MSTRGCFRSSVWQHLRAFVAEKGGGVAFAAGPRFFPWLYQDNADVAALLPIEIGALPSDPKLPADVTPRVHRPPHSSSACKIPPSNWATRPPTPNKSGQPRAAYTGCFEVSELKPGAQVFAEGPPSTLRTSASAIPRRSCFQYFGAGRVLFLAIDSTWRWRIGAGDTFFARYWVQTIRFLGPRQIESRSRRARSLPTGANTVAAKLPQLRARFLDPRIAPTGDEVTDCR